ncbi:potassium channel family protein [Mycobacteroides abscessus]
MSSIFPRWPRVAANEAPLPQPVAAGQQPHVIVAGLGSRGQAAVDSLLRQGCCAGDIVVVDQDPRAMGRVGQRARRTVVGSALSACTLQAARVNSASTVVIAIGTDSAVLRAAELVRQRSTARIVVSVHDKAFVPLARDCGADVVVCGSMTAGRVAAAAITTPSLAATLQKVLAHPAGYLLAERPVRPSEIGTPATDLPHVIAVRRGAQLLRAGYSSVVLAAGDRLVHAGPAQPCPTGTPRGWLP